MKTQIVLLPVGLLLMLGLLLWLVFSPPFGPQTCLIPKANGSDAPAEGLAGNTRQPISPAPNDSGEEAAIGAIEKLGGTCEGRPVGSVDLGNTAVTDADLVWL
ncbi:MAG TPA: hypothetical protein VMY42_01345, partial [Thermoguttaceae bacterium]|nr:hypothetical protein [Thermoguttaceae bacterium]